MRPALVVVADFGRKAALERIACLVHAARPGSVLVQLRDHDLPTRKRYGLGVELRKITSDSGQYLAVNDRVDLALLLGADGLHLGELSIETADARALLQNTWISRACHRTSDAALLDADAILLSPIVEARHGRPALGTHALSEARRALGDTKLLFAFGGVSKATARACLEAGADGVAVMGAVLDSDDPTPLLDALGIRG